MQRVINHVVLGECLIRDFLKTKYSYRQIHLLSEGGKIFLNGEEVTVRKKAVKGDRLTLIFEEKLQFNYPPQDMGLKQIYSDQDLLIVYKPEGVPSMPVAPHYDKNLFNGLAFLCPNVVFRVVTRLDKDTSGLVLLAKNSVSHSTLYDRVREIKKQYVALVEGTLEYPKIINAPILSTGEQKRVVSESGKPAVTEIVSAKPFENYSLVTLNLETGRTHQIRVHMSHIGNPLVGDSLYGAKSSGGQLLVCSKLEFNHPISGEKITVEINGEQEILQRLKKRT